METTAGSGCSYTITRTWTVTDDCGNQTIAQQTLTVTDSAPPVMFAIHTFFGEIQHGDTLYADCSQIPSLDSIGFSAYDLCGATTIDFTETVVQGSCSVDGFTELRYCGWTATDACGNVDSLFFTVIINDQLAPVIAGVPADATVECGQVPPVPLVTATDNCDPAPVLSFVETIAGTGCDLTITRTWTATDDCGNTATEVQIITVVDSSSIQIVFTNPVLSGLGDGDTLVIPCSNPAIFDAGDAEAVGGCGDTPVVFNENGITPGNCNPPSGGQGGDGFIVIMHCTWMATDTCGNTASVTLHMMVVDNVPPVFSNAPADLTINCTDPLPPCGNPTVSDDCGNVALTSNSTTVLTADGYDRICTWTATDDCGNIATASSTVHVVDNEAPVISGVPADSTIYLANGETVPLAATVTATDGCPAQSIPVVFSETSAPMGNDSCMTKIIRTWSATDSDGNTVVQQQEIIVVGFMDVDIASTTPDTCGMGIGSATLLPDSYGFAWSGGGNGNIRNNLSAGTYTVTATNYGCTEVLIVTITNVQVPLAIESINTTPETCAGGDGTATISPANYDYAWSDPTGASAGTGAVRNDLAAGSYTVTATNGACSLVFTVDIADGCDCVAAVLDSLNITDATCGNADGTATLSLAGDVTDYGFLWIPNLGTANAAGNARTDLPASHYVVFVTYKGNNNCVEKFEFDIFDDCPKCAPIFSTELYTVSVSDSPGLVCLPVPFAALSQQVVEMDGAPTAGNLTPCDPEDVLNYGFEAFPNGLLQVRWRFAADTFYTLVNDLGAVAGFMNQLDTTGNWSFDAVNRRFVSGNVVGGYGKLQITHLPTGEVQESKAKMVKVAMGTSLYLTTGAHQLVVSNASTGCSDTLNITVNLEAIVQVEPSTLQPDTLRTKQGTPVIGDVLANDVIKQHIKQMTIAEQPANGTAWVNVDNTVSYRPLIECCNSYEHQPLDQFTYEVCFENGKRMQSTVSVEVACEDEVPATEITLYPNPTNRLVYLDLSPIAGKPVVVEVFNNLGVKMQTVRLDEAPSIPLKIELDGYAAGHYAVVINSPGSRPFVRQLIVGGR